MKRYLIVVAALLAGACMEGETEPEVDPSGVEAILSDRALAGIEQRIDGRIGMALVTEDGETWHSYRGDERFAMCSTFKLPLAAAILARTEAGDLVLDEAIAFDESDILEYAPVVRSYIGTNEMRVEALAGAAVMQSDNSAANLLLERIGGPEAMTAFFRAHGDDVSRLDRIEPGLNENAENDPRDTTSPEAMAMLVRTLIFGEALDEESRTTLAEWAIATRTGANRIRAGLPEGWRAGNKTGTCGYDETGAVNDVAIVWPPGGPAFVLAVYIDRPDASAEDIEAAIAEIGEMTAFYVTERNIE